jgi:2-dehydro-3-deoxyphosphogluconate aldolase/(4S)-4-hydroxy-2-oxoglutarate aldolase
MQSPCALPKEVINVIKSVGIIPVFYHPEVNTILQAIRTAYRCGARVFEFLHQRDNRGLRIFSWLVDETRAMPDLILGVGTVLDATMTDRYIKAGAQFISSPFLRKDMAEVCHRASVLWMPGCSTQTDIREARECGASIVMIIPGNVLGPDFLRRAVLEYTDLHFIPSGGVDLTEASLRSWIHSGAPAVRLGEQLFPRDAIVAQEWDKIERNVRMALEHIQKLKSPGKKNSLLSIVL